MLVPRAEGATPYRLLISPFRPGQKTGFADTRLALVIIVDLDKPLPIKAQTLVDIFDMTPAEARVALQIAEGLTAIEVASSLGMSHGTVRTHLKRVFSKVGVTNQTRLAVEIHKLVT